MKGIEFGRKGTEGLRGEGINETKGWASLRKEPFAGENAARLADRMTEQANEINAILESIDSPKSGDEQSVQPEVNAQNPKEIQNETQRQIDNLKNNLHDIFG